MSSIAKPSLSKPLPPAPPPTVPLPATPLEWEAYEASQFCEDDRCARTHNTVWHCIECARSYCDSCWGLQGPHRPRRRVMGSEHHEKTAPCHAELIDSVLHPDPGMASRLHAEDQYTKWIGLVRDSEGQLVLEDYGRFDSLWSSLSDSHDGVPRYPHLVSFVGETNAGKSTLIKLLIAAGSGVGVGEATYAASPVTGSAANEMDPTSGDVHLYTDPRTAGSQHPIMFVDCEGLRGGERVPLGSRMRWANDDRPDHGTFSAYGQIRVRPIEWLKTDNSKGREHAVGSIYPRLLYAFSDCVVFVLRNPKTVESALSQLLEWGNTALEKSINQPSLPHCILVLNNVSSTTSDPEWEVSKATRSLLASIDHALGWAHGVSHVKRLRQYWQSIGHDISSIESLLLCYYSSFRVLRIPGKPKYESIHGQVIRLRETIAVSCNAAFSAKRTAQASLQADKLSRCLQNALDHYTAHLYQPFDFTSVVDNESGPDVRCHILHLLTTLSSKICATQSGDLRDASLTKALRALIPTLASAAVLDCARRRAGQSRELHKRYYQSYCRALNEYLDLHHPCSRQGVGGSRQCELVKVRHRSQGHQDVNGFFCAGNYETSLKVFTWMEDLRSEMEDTLSRFQIELEREEWSDFSTAGELAAWIMHLDNLNAFFETTPVTAIRSHATCFSCLTSVAEHPLECGHVLCAACIKAFGITIGASVRLYACPLHRRTAQWAEPTIVNFIPSGAGIRALSLERGGTRAILQLELLRGLRKVLCEMGGELPVCSLFDLIVGAETGALNAALLDRFDDQVDVCDVFSNICQLLFDRRSASISWTGLRIRSRRYSSNRLINVLKTAFHENTPLFRQRQHHERGTRVGLTCQSLDGSTTALLANYRRSDDPCDGSSSPYQFERPHEPSGEVTIWESIARCLAGQFGPMPNGSKVALSGGNNAVVPSPAVVALREARLLEAEAKQVDLLVSLGTGRDDRSTKARQIHTRIIRAVRRGGSSADEVAWNKLLQTDQRAAAEKRYIRFDDNFGDAPCAEDDCHEITRVRRRMHEVLSPESSPSGQSSDNMAAQSLRRRLQYLACRLIATCFYVSKEVIDSSPSLTRPWTCSIMCRFAAGSDEMISLCRIIQKHGQENFKPHFKVWPDQMQSNIKLKAPIVIVNDVIVSSRIDVQRAFLGRYIMCSLFLCPDDGLAPDGLPISGTPQELNTQILKDRDSPLHLEDKVDTGTRRPSSSRPIGRRQDRREYSFYSQQKMSQALTEVVMEENSGSEFSERTINDMLKFCEDWIG